MVVMEKLCLELHLRTQDKHDVRNFKTTSNRWHVVVVASSMAVLVSHKQTGYDWILSLLLLLHIDCAKLPAIHMSTTH